MSHDVFISYSSKDRDAALDLCRALEAGHVRVWIAERDIKPASTWSEEIPNAIEKAKLVLFVCSKHVDSSIWIPREIEYAVDKAKRVMTVRLANTELAPNFRFYLNSLHRVDAFPGALSSHLPRITQHCQDILNIKRERKAAPPTSAATQPKPKSPAPSARPAPDRLRYGLAAGAAVAALLVAWGAISLFSSPAEVTAVTQAGAAQVSRANSFAGACSPHDQNALIDSSFKISNLPDDDHPQGLYVVMDVATLQVGSRVVKLSRVGKDMTHGADRLREWLMTSATTVACYPTDAQGCRYSCSIDSGEDISGKILSSGWATPLSTTVSSDN